MGCERHAGQFAHSTRRVARSGARFVGTMDGSSSRGLERLRASSIHILDIPIYSPAVSPATATATATAAASASSPAAAAATAAATTTSAITSTKFSRRS